MEKTIITILLILSVLSVSGQELGSNDSQANDQASEWELNRYDFVIYDTDTVISISPESRAANTGIRLDNGIVYYLSFFEDYSIYELYMSLPDSSGSNIIIIQTISWGDYKALGNKILFHDRIAGFKMEATVGSAGMKFHEDYFPGLDEEIWDTPQPETSTFGLYAIFDKKKAKRYRKAYDKKHREPIEFTPGIYIAASVSLEISEDGRWTQKYGDVVLAHGEWRRQRNILVLNCPKLGCNFYMTIGEKRLTSMLLLMDIFGSYYYSIPEYNKFFPKELQFQP